MYLDKNSFNFTNVCSEITSLKSHRLELGLSLSHKHQFEE